MTLISHRRKFIFVHIYKTGGTSISSVLSKYCRIVDQIQYSENRFIHSPAWLVNKFEGFYTDRQDGGGGSLFTGFHKHATSAELLGKIPMYFNDYKTFAILRDPFSWVLSLFNYIKTRKRHHLKFFASQGIQRFVDYFVSSGMNTQSCHVCNNNDEQLVKKLFVLENLSVNCSSLEAYLGLEEAIKMPKLNQSICSKINLSAERFLKENLSNNLYKKLVMRLEKDINLYSNAYESIL